VLFSWNIFELTFGHEIANHALQLYRVDTLVVEVIIVDIIGVTMTTHNSGDYHSQF